MIVTTVRPLSAACAARIASLLDELARQAPALLGRVCVLPDRCLAVVNTRKGRALLEVSFAAQDKPQDIISALVMRAQEEM